MINIDNNKSINLDNEYYKPYKQVFINSDMPEFFKVSKLIDNILFHEKYGSLNQLNALKRILTEYMNENNISNEFIFECYDYRLN